MASEKRGARSAAIRQYLAEHPSAGPKEVVDSLKLAGVDRSEEHTSELQSQSNLVCRLLLETKKIALSSVPTGSIWSTRCCIPPPPKTTGPNISCHPTRATPAARPRSLPEARMRPPSAERAA